MKNPLLDIENSKILADTAHNTQKRIKHIYKNKLNAYIPNKKQANENKNKKFKKICKSTFHIQL
jgi:predicted glycosyltransferase involved in capsule biosynthesis